MIVSGVLEVDPATPAAKKLCYNHFSRSVKIRETIGLGGGFKFQLLFIFTSWGNDPILQAYFSDGLKPPTSRCLSKIIMMFVSQMFPL